MSKKIRVATLSADDLETRTAAAALLARAFDDPLRYGAPRIARELEPEAAPFYRQAFVAWLDDELVGAACIKAANWASELHILYLSGVEPSARGQGVGRALVQARLDWVREHHRTGGLLVSTRHQKRFSAYGFKAWREDSRSGRALMWREL
jgi:GNAT superfamily N-acetyltransferase